MDSKERPAYDAEVMEKALDALYQKGIGSTEKGPAWQHGSHAASTRELVDAHVNVSQLPTPLLLIRESAMRNNIATMANYCERYKVALAPHAKTTMSPQIFKRQLAAGAWGLTAATVRQANVYRAFGVRRIILANELVDPAAIAWVAAERRRDPAMEMCCYVDSREGVALLDEALRSHGADGSDGLFPVLVELGLPGGRTGARDQRGVLDVARAVAETRTLGVVGVACFEGIVGQAEGEDAAGAAAAFCARLRDAGSMILSEGLSTCGMDGMPGKGDFVLSAGGSSYFDAVTQELATGWPEGAAITVVLRSGCYVTHDHGRYAQTSPFERQTAGDGSLEPALELRSRVLSRPEKGRAYLDAGRRDVAFDAGLPVVLGGQSRDGASIAVAGMTITALNDQHAFASIPEQSTLAVGDLLLLGISHPCTTFDKWRTIAIADEDGYLTDVAHTFF